MKSSLVILIVSTFLVISQVSATLNLCNCQNEGIDVCNCGSNSGREVGPRPKPVQRPSSILFPKIKICTEPVPTQPNFQPIGDLCSSCRRNPITPAPRPRPQCQCQNPNFPSFCDLLHRKCPCPDCNPTDKPDECPEDSTTERPQPCKCKKHRHHHRRHRESSSSSVSADPVSVSIANQKSQNAKSSVSEWSLNYGAIRPPKVVNQGDEKISVVTRDEGDLLESKGKVLEIQSNSEAENSEESQPIQLNYDQIGYHPYQSDDQQYVIVHAEESTSNPRSRKHRLFHRQ